MKKLISGALVLALSIGAAQAQSTTPEKKEGHKKEHRQGGFHQLNLTEDQKARFKSIHESLRREMDAVKNNKSLSAEQQKAQRETLRTKYKAQFESILTTEQKAQLEKAKSERKSAAKNGDFKKGEGFRRGRGGDSTSRKRAFEGRKDFGQELNLTADQKAKMEKIRADFRPRFEALKTDKSLSQEDKRAKMGELMKAQQEQTKSILTKEQVEKLQSLRKDRSYKGRSERNTK